MTRLSPGLLRRLVLGLVVALPLAACGELESGAMKEAPAPVAAEMAADEEAMVGGGGLAMAPEPEASSSNRQGLKGASKKRAHAAPKAPGAPARDQAYGSAESAPDPEEDDADAAEPEVVRAWFPETLLFEPSVVTDKLGTATVPVLVPDRLTDWRVLALAHSREGAQAGALARFSSRMDAYVDAVVPPLLRAGDRAVLPVQVVNTTDAPLARALTVTAEGGTLSGGNQRLTLPARGSKTVYLPLRADEPGEVVIKATLAGEDAVVRRVPVDPVGKPGELTWSGNLAGPRTRTLTVPDDARPASVEARLTVFPGALAILRAELLAAPSRRSIAHDAYALLLAARARKLGAALGAPVDEDELRRLRLIGAQRVIGHARSPDPATAALLAEAALAHGDDPLLARLGERLVDQVARAQRPDGTFGGGSGWPLQRLVAATAEGMRAVTAGKERGSRGERRYIAARLRARAAFGRHLPRVEDAYTAATVLAANVVDDKLAGELRERVKKALNKSDNGTRWLPVDENVVRGDGRRPSEVEATALAALALADDKEAGKLLPDLGAWLLARYRGGAGFGDGQSNLVALSAVASIFDQPLPARVTVRLKRGDEALADTVLEGDKLKKQSGVVARPEDAVGAGQWTVEADPPVPGLAFTLALSWRTPWPPPDEDEVQVGVTLPPRMSVGQAARVTVRATAPGGSALVVVQTLPAGVQPDRGSLEELQKAGTLQGFEVRDGQVTLRAPSRRQGQAFVATYKVSPTLSGSLQSGPTRLEARGETAWLPGDTWEIAR